MIKSFTKMAAVPMKVNGRTSRINGVWCGGSVETDCTSALLVVCKALATLSCNHHWSHVIHMLCVLLTCYMYIHSMCIRVLVSQIVCAVLVQRVSSSGHPC